MLKIKSGGFSNDFAFRSDGDTEEVGYWFGQTGPGWGCSGATFQNDAMAYTMIETSASGVIEWKAKNEYTVRVVLLGHIR